MAIFRRSASSRRGGVTPFKAGLIAVVIVVVATYFAYTQANPFADAFQFQAAFNTVNNLRADAPVRIAGVEVGVVKEVAPLGDSEDGAMVTMEIEDHGLPIHEDAELKVRPRIFLEGNEFVDLQPGSPSAPALEEDDVIPVNQTATPVQFGQVLSTLQTDTREDLRTLLEEFGLKALKGGGARGFRDSIKYWEDAYKNSALANEAALGTQPGDLFRVLNGQQQVAEALTRAPEDLADLVTNFNTTAAAFASEDDALQATIPALRDVLAVGRPALQSLNSSFPGIQRFAVDALPGVRSSRKTIPETFPFIRQLRLLVRPSELRGLVADLRRAIPDLARLNKRTIPLLRENRTLSACTNETLLPFARTPIPTGDPGAAPNTASNADFPWAPDSTMQPFFEQGPRAFVGLSGESRTSDANNKFFRANFKTDSALDFFAPAPGFLGSPTLGENLLLLADPESEFRPAPPPEVGIPGSPLEEYRRPVFRPDFPCELSVEPDMRAPSESVTTAGNDIDLCGALGLPQFLCDQLGIQASGGDEAQQIEALTQLLSPPAPEDEEEQEAAAEEDGGVNGGGADGGAEAETGQGQSATPSVPTPALPEEGEE
jgi:virulence factor Mce-like protein